MKPAWEAPPARPPLEFTPEILFVFAFCAVVGLFSYFGVHAWHFVSFRLACVNEDSIPVVQKQ